jgi:hypothetical protein
MSRIARIGGAAVLCAGLFAVAPSADASPMTESFDYTGAAATFAVPAGICQVTVEAWGAEGGEGGDPQSPTAGLGGMASATIDVTPGDSLTVYAGGAGIDGDAGGAGGFNGGGQGGQGGPSESYNGQCSIFCGNH